MKDVASLTLRLTSEIEKQIHVIVSCDVVGTMVKQVVYAATCLLGCKATPSMFK